MREADKNSYYFFQLWVHMFATLLAEFRFFLELTIYCVYLLEMVLKNGIMVLYPYHSHLSGF